MRTVIVILVFIVLPWLLFFLYYNRTNQYKKTNLSLHKNLEKKNAELNRLIRDKQNINQLKEETEKYKTALAELQLELREYKAKNNDSCEPIHHNKNSI